MNNKFLSFVIVMVLIAGGIFLFMGRGVAPTDLDIETPASEDQGITVGEPNPNTPAGDDTDLAEVKEFSIDSNNFAFAPKTMSVKKGDTVRITLTNRQGNHDLKIDEFNAATRVLSTGESDTIEFVASEAGSFEYYCSVGTHRQMGMVGTLTVTE